MIFTRGIWRLIQYKVVLHIGVVVLPVEKIGNP
jgi:hypothetical protein